MTTSSPRPARTAVSRGPAKPRKPPTPVGPLADAGSCAGEPGAETTREDAMVAGVPPALGTTDVLGGRGAGRKATSSTATSSAAAADAATGTGRGGVPPAIEDQMACSPASVSAAQSAT